jgi:hypothetical protein
MQCLEIGLILDQDQMLSVKTKLVELLRFPAEKWT